MKHLPWDSEFFGFKIGSLENIRGIRSLETGLRSAKKQRFRCLYLEMSTATLPLASELARKGLQLVDIKTTLQKKPLIPAIVSSSIQEKRDRRLLRALEAIGSQISIWSRFAIDTKFSPKAKKLYRLWTKNSFAEGFCDHFYYFLKDGAPEGFITIRTRNGVPFIDLLGVNRLSRGAGIGSELVKAAENWALDRGFKELRVVTQGCNLDALRFYQQHGYITCDVKLFYHCWL